MQDMQNKAQDVIDAKYNEFRNSVMKQRNVRSFTILEDIKTMIANYRKLGIKISTKDVNELFSDEERENVYREFFLEGYHDPEWTSSSRSVKDIFYLAHDFTDKLGCIATPEVCGKIFCQLLSGANGYTESYEYSMHMLCYKNLKEGYFPITVEAAKQLVEWRDYVYWNKELVFDKVRMTGKKEEEIWQRYYVRKRKEVIAILESAENIFLMDQHSYYSYVKLGDKIPK